MTRLAPASTPIAPPVVDGKAQTPPSSRGVVITGVVLALASVGLLCTARFAGWWRVEVGAWAVCLGSILTAAYAADGRRPLRLPRLRAAELAALALLVALTAGARLYALGQIPAEIHGDSAECGTRGLEILEGHFPNLFAFSEWYRTPYVSFLPYAASFALEGVSVRSLRLPCALIGIVVVLPLYFLTRRWYGVSAALFTAFFYALSHPAVHFSRIGLWNVQITFYAVTAFWLMTAAMDRGSILLGGVAGLVTGLAMYSYTAGRIIPVVLLVVCLWQLLVRPASLRSVLRAGFAYALVALLAIVPLILDYVQEPLAFAEDRTAGVAIFAEDVMPHLKEAYGTDSHWGVLRGQALLTVEGLFWLGDASGQYATEKPIFRWITFAFLLVGCAVAARRFWQPRNFFVLVWLVLSLLLGSVLVLDPPSLTRWVATFPVLYILVALGLVSSMNLLRRRFPQTPLAPLLGGLVAAQFALFNITGYWHFAERMAVQPGREWDVVKVLERRGGDRDYYLFTGPHMLPESPVMNLFFRKVRAITAISEVDIPPRLARDTTFILTPSYRRAAHWLEEHFPGIERDVVLNDGLPQVIVYECSDSNGCRKG